MNMLALEHVSLKIDEQWLIQEASLTLVPGQLVACLGPNGAGKTTLLRLLAGLWQPTKGKASLNGRKLHQFHPQKLAQQITFVPQNTVMGFAFTVKEIIMMGRNPHLGRFQSETEYDHHCVKQAMIKTDVLHLANRLVTELSGGERQRVVIARSLATVAPIILLDEPTASLDVAHVLEILTLLAQLAREGKTIVFSTHDINIAMRYANQVVLMYNGRIFDWGLPQQVLTNEAFTQVFNVKAKTVSISTGETAFFFYQ